MRTLDGNPGPWLVPRWCFFCHRREQDHARRRMPMYRVHGEGLLMHVCTDHLAEASDVVGLPQIVHELDATGKVTADELHNEDLALRAAAAARRAARPPRPGMTVEGSVEHDALLERAYRELHRIAEGAEEVRDKNNTRRDGTPRHAFKRRAMGLDP